MAEVMFDTDILVDYLRGFEPSRSTISKIKDGRLTGYISTITETELFAGEDEKNEEKNALLSELIDMFQKVDVTSAIARRAGKIKRDYGMGVPDSIIAASAMSLNCKLFTRNIKDYETLRGLSVEKPY